MAFVPSTHRGSHIRHPSFAEGNISRFHKSGSIRSWVLVVVQAFSSIHHTQQVWDLVQGDVSGPLG